MDLFNYYSLDECVDTKVIKKRLNQLKKEGSAEFSIDGDILKLTDISLDENEIEELISMFDKYDVFPYPDYEDGLDEEDDDYYDDEYNNDDY
jgi:hypothetical protein